ncbi:TPR-like protein [Microstroma glucosiphilum]|uniref:TPR-like protein n=1 Tax=Pseudomicrostroma glucosiphilum TaxID=1684307 RepID=A0A316U1I8_9BASI|nr:TPR-like protein [Pseudomicrostroma glucosiphilum]PWN18313.1 TPR-like protein [Pseudomicrostroma glucosiphilum]
MTSKPDKADLYAKEVDRARLRGDWTGDTVGQEAKGKGVGWSELLRKYGKHNNTKQGALAIITTEQSLRSSLVAFYREKEYSDISHEADDASPKEGKTLFPPNVPADGTGHGWSGSDYEKTAAQLETYASDTRHDDGKQQGVVAMYAHALFTLGRDEEAVGLLHDSRFLETVNTDQVRPEEQSDEYQTALFMMGFVTYGMANERLHTLRPNAGYHPFAFAGYARAIELHEELRGGRRAKALPGLPEDEIERWAETALYRNALFSVREGDVSLGLNALRAYQAHVTRWPKDFRLPQRNVINRTYLRELNTGLELGHYAPPPAAPGKSHDDWRSQAYQRAVVAGVASRVYIRDFVSERSSKSNMGKRHESYGYGTKSLASRTVSKRRPFPFRNLGAPSDLWANEMQTVSKMAAANVLRSSDFPRAGKVNLSALLLADELFKGWQFNGELGGVHADDLVESMYTLSRLTFHSQRISRHLFTLLTASQAYAEARCALELYISIVDKAREGDAAGSAALVEENALREKKQKEEGYDLDEVVKKEKEEEDKDPEEQENGDQKKKEHGGGVSEKAKKAASQVSVDSDNDATFVATLLAGAHVLAKYLNDATAADSMAKKALAIITKEEKKEKEKEKGKEEEEEEEKEQATPDFSPEHVARAYRIAGEARANWGLKTVAPEKLAAIQAEALTLLEESLRLDAQSSEGWFALAYLQAQMGETKVAIGSVRKAIELEPANVKSWHLLVLLVSSTKDFKAAFELAEVALDEAEADDEADSAQQVNQAATMNGNGHTNGEVSQPSRTQLLSVDFPPTTLERAESTLQLMMTQNALEELISGADVAIASQKDLFLFFHDRIAFHLEAGASNRGGLPAAAAAAAQNGSAAEASHAYGLSRLLSRSGQGKKGDAGQSGLGQSGAATNGTSGSLRGMSRSGSQAQQGGPEGEGAIPLDGPTGPSISAGNGSSSAATVSPQNPLGTSATPGDARKLYQLHRETSLLSDLWLLSSASFRRVGQLAQSRTAIQEAERLDAGRPHLWTQLALLSEKVGEVALAVEALHKALACDRDYVPANVHLARLFLTRGDEVLPATRPNTSLHQGTEESPSHAKDSTRSRCIAGDLSDPEGTTGSAGAGAGANPKSSSVDSARTALAAASASASATAPADASSVGDVLDSAGAKSIATLCLAEGLLLTTTSTPAASASGASGASAASASGAGSSGVGGAQSPEAWLFLGQVYGRTGRRERARECLRYALRLEERRMVRDLSVLGL